MTNWQEIISQIKTKNLNVDQRDYFDVDAGDEYGYTFLHKAVDEVNISVCKQLINLGADVNAMCDTITP